MVSGSARVTSGSVCCSMLLLSELGSACAGCSSSFSAVRPSDDPWFMRQTRRGRLGTHAVPRTHLWHRGSVGSGPGMAGHVLHDPILLAVTASQVVQPGGHPRTHAGSRRAVLRTPAVVSSCTQMHRAITCVPEDPSLAACCLQPAVRVERTVASAGCGSLCWPVVCCSWGLAEISTCGWRIGRVGVADV